MKSMPRRVVRSFALGTSLAVALAIVGPLAAAGAAGGGDAPEAFATLKVTKDTVSIKAKGESTFKPAKDGDELHAGDTVSTDATGKATIKYGDEAYTRLDVDTTFKITKLTDEEGNRQVEGIVESGNTWNRTTALTESESFEQTGADATAAVEGTAYGIQCDTTNHCIFTGVVDDVTLTGKDGQKLVGPLDQCDSTSGVLCAELTKLTPDQLSAWIIENLLLDVAEGFPWPFGTGTLVVDGDTITFVPGTPTAPSTAPTIGADGVVCDESCENDWGPGGLSADAATVDGIVPSWFDPVEDSEIVTTDNSWFAGVKFVPNVATNPTDQTLYVVFKTLPTDVGKVFVYCDDCTGAGDASATSSYWWPQVVQTDTVYRLGAPPADADALTGGGSHVTYFKFVPKDLGNDWYNDTAPTEDWERYPSSMTFFVTTDPTLTDPSQNSADATVDVTVYDDDEPDDCYYGTEESVGAAC